MPKERKPLAESQINASNAPAEKEWPVLTKSQRSEMEQRFHRILDEAFPPDSRLITPEVIRERLRNRK